MPDIPSPSDHYPPNEKILREAFSKGLNSHFDKSFDDFHKLLSWLLSFGDFSGNNFHQAFGAYAPTVQDHIVTYEKLERSDLNNLNIGWLKDFSETCKSILSHIYDTERLHDEEAADYDLYRFSDEFYRLLDKLSSLVIDATSDHSARQISTDSAAREAQLQILETRNRLRKQQVEADQLMAQIRLQGENIGVSQNAAVFIEHAEMFSDSATRWRRATITMLAITFAAAIGSFLFVWFTDETKPVKLAQLFGAKIIILSTLSFATVWCARNYRSLKHNELLNLHRANALATFKAFNDGTEDPHVKDTILLQAAHAAFSNRPTGYGHHESDDKAPAVEVIQKVLPSITGGE